MSNLSATQRACWRASSSSCSSPNPAEPAGRLERRRRHLRRWKELKHDPRMRVYLDLVVLSARCAVTATASSPGPDPPLTRLGLHLDDRASVNDGLVRTWRPREEKGGCGGARRRSAHGCCARKAWLLPRTGMFVFPHPDVATARQPLRACETTLATLSRSGRDRDLLGAGAACARGRPDRSRGAGPSPGPVFGNDPDAGVETVFGREQRSRGSLRREPRPLGRGGIRLEASHDDR